MSPFLQRKYSLQAHQQRLNESNIPRWHPPHYGRSISATASPNLEAHRRYQTAIPVLDMDRNQMVRLKGNTSPIGKQFLLLICCWFGSEFFLIDLNFLCENLVLQRFYHQQSQLREKESNGHLNNSPLNVSHPPYKVDYEKRINELNDKEHRQQTNPFLRQIPKLTHKLNPFKQPSPKHSLSAVQHHDDGVVDEPVYANSHIPIYQKQYDHYHDGAPKENIHRQRIPINPPADIYYEKTAYPAVTYDEHCAIEPNHTFNPTTSSTNKEKKGNGTKNTSDDPGKLAHIKRTINFIGFELLV